MIDAVTGSTLAAGAAAGLLMVSPLDSGGRGGHDEGAGVVDDALLADVEVGRGGRLEHDHWTLEALPGGERGALYHLELAPIPGGEGVGARGLAVALRALPLVGHLVG